MIGKEAHGFGDDLLNDDGTKSFHVVMLGSGGGPNEDNVMGMLVRSIEAGWTKNSVLAMDAGVHLSAIIRILDKHLPAAIRYTPPGEQKSQPVKAFSPVEPLPQSRSASEVRRAQQPPFSPVLAAQGASPRASPGPQPREQKPKLVMTTGPFKNILMPAETAKANALQMMHYLVSTYLITHPHLDHVSGFAINTASFQSTSRPKKLAALPGCIESIKRHIFNDLIWPNLSDEDGGVGFVSYARLVEGGNISLGGGGNRGYIELCEGLEVKCWGVSHGHCMRSHVHGGMHHESPPPPAPVGYATPADRRASRGFAPPPHSPTYRRGSNAHSEYMTHHYTTQCVIDSTAAFIRDQHSCNEILVFGDVEPDTVSLAPRNARVWSDAAPKIAAGTLKAIFIECSYDDSQADEILFGHLAPRHVIAELAVLAEKVHAVRQQRANGAAGSPAFHAPPYGQNAAAQHKRKRVSDGIVDDLGAQQRRGRHSSRNSSSHAGRTSVSPATLIPRRGTEDESSAAAAGDRMEITTTTPPPPQQTPLAPPSTGTGTFPPPHPFAADAVRAASPAIREARRLSYPARKSSHGRIEPVHAAQLLLQRDSIFGGAGGGSGGGSAPHSAPLVPDGVDANHSGGVSGNHAAMAVMPGAGGYGERPLAGLKVVLIHIKDTLSDGDSAAESVLRCLLEHEEERGLGCEFVVPEAGDSLYI